MNNMFLFLLFIKLGGIGLLLNCKYSEYLKTAEMFGATKWIIFDRLLFCFVVFRAGQDVNPN